MRVRPLLVRDPRPPGIGGSPIVGPRPSYLALGSPEPPGPVQRREWVGYLFWGLLVGAILVTEVLAAFWKGSPIPTISGTTGHLEREHHWFRLVVVGVLSLVIARIVFYPWPARQAED